ncbi:helix-turn-helix domain-containing protein [Brevundimonas sp. 'scallop']|uniref:DNA-binding protein n=1 Tax=Brevundimonas vesicularis TaxID=41276 RepID=A0A1Z3UCP0_BREVE|nr:DNA-binding protein [Brevundimonas vesicularis]QIF81890.1 helix-turn-helix domain-containing protein [Brevundimonas sp. 'scallop']
MSAANDNFVLTFDQTCRELQVGEHTLRAIIADGSLRAGKIGRQWRVRRDDLNAYLEALTCRSINAATSGGTTSPSTVSDTAARPARASRKTQPRLKTVSSARRSWEVYTRTSP